MRWNKDDNIKSSKRYSENKSQVSAEANIENLEVKKKKQVYYFVTVLKAERK